MWKTAEKFSFDCNKTRLNGAMTRYSFKIDIFHFMCLSVCLCVYVCSPRVYSACGDRRAHRIPWNWSHEWCELPCACWKTDSSPLKEPQVFLTAESSLQPPHTCPSVSCIFLIRQLFAFTLKQVQIKVKLIWLRGWEVQRLPSVPHHQPRGFPQNPQASRQKFGSHFSKWWPEF